ncbi:hypothetical protein [Erwinia sp. 198]|uniref:hypothetical protein n=1 Tax=Erwinia sp. 198 TaxID=2022746 RepID=UPI000F66275F|nr:hypothetical protein [Erwinia sp. 198]RRZ91031.1 hypothetical protein EGK14_13490 [Erwinia sp. 198]
MRDFLSPVHLPKTAGAAAGIDEEEVRDLAVEYTNNYPIGRFFRYRPAGGAPIVSRTLIVILQWAEEGLTIHDRDKFILTVYPKPEPTYD